MKKLDTLRAYLTNYLTSIDVNPDALQIHADDGHIIHRHGENLGYMYRLQCHVTVLEYSEEADTIVLPLVMWLRSNAVELFQNHDQSDTALQIEMDLLDAGARDIRITFPLTESIDVLRKPDGEYEATPRNEPPAFDQPLTDPVAMLKQIRFNGKLLVPEA